MGISAQDRIDRRSVIGSSDTPALLGQDPNRSKLEVYVSKTQALEEGDQGEAIELGNDFEVPLLRWAARELGVRIIKNHKSRGENKLFASNHDAVVVKKRWGLEAKVRTFDPKEFGAEGTDEIPARVILQTQHQMYTGRLERVYVPVMFPLNGRLTRKLYKVERSERLIAHLVEEGQRFWEEHVLTRTPPPAVFGSVDLFKQVQREAGMTATVDAILVQAWEARRAERLAAEKAEALAYTNLLAQVGNADAWEWGDPEGLYYTFFEYSRTDLDLKRLKNDKPDLWDAYGKECRWRTPYRRNPAKAKKEG